MDVTTFRIAVRNKEGEARVFKVQHEAITSHEQAISLTRDVMPDALVIMALVNTTKE